MRSYAIQLPGLTRSAAARVHREGRLSLALLQIAALGSGLESEQAAAYNSGDHGEGNEEENRLHCGWWYGCPLLPRLLSYLYGHPGSYGGRMSFGPCGVKEFVHRIVTDIEVGALIADDGEISSVRRVIKLVRSWSELVFPQLRCGILILAKSN